MLSRILRAPEKNLKKGDASQKKLDVKKQRIKILCYYSNLNLATIMELYHNISNNFVIL